MNTNTNRTARSNDPAAAIKKAKGFMIFGLKSWIKALEMSEGNKKSEGKFRYEVSEDASSGRIVRTADGSEVEGTARTRDQWAAVGRPARLASIGLRARKEELENQLKERVEYTFDVTTGDARLTRNGELVADEPTTIADWAVKGQAVEKSLFLQLNVAIEWGIQSAADTTRDSHDQVRRHPQACGAGHQDGLNIRCRHIMWRYIQSRGYTATLKQEAPMKLKYLLLALIAVVFCLSIAQPNFVGTVMQQTGNTTQTASSPTNPREPVVVKISYGDLQKGLSQNPKAYQSLTLVKDASGVQTASVTMTDGTVAKVELAGDASTQALVDAAVKGDVKVDVQKREPTFWTTTADSSSGSPSSVSSSGGCVRGAMQGGAISQVTRIPQGTKSPR
jgi:hypothetical protein